MEQSDHNKEIELILTLVEEYKHILESQDKSPEMKEQKKLTWDVLTDKFNARNSGPPKPSSYVRTKYVAKSSVARREFEQFRWEVYLNSKRKVKKNKKSLEIIKKSTISQSSITVKHIKTSMNASDAHMYQESATVTQRILFKMKPILQKKAVERLSVKAGVLIEEECLNRGIKKLKNRELKFLQKSISSARSHIKYKLRCEKKKETQWLSSNGIEWGGEHFLGSYDACEPDTETIKWEPIESCEVKIEVENSNSDISLDEDNIKLENNDLIETDIDISSDLDESIVKIENNNLRETDIDISSELDETNVKIEHNDSLSADIPLELNEVNVNLENNDLRETNIDISSELDETNVKIEHNDLRETDIDIASESDETNVKIEHNDLIDISSDLDETDINLENNDSLSADIPLELNEVNVNLENNDLRETNIDISSELDETNVKIEHNDLRETDIDIASESDETNVKIEHNDLRETDIDIASESDETNVKIEHNDLIDISSDLDETNIHLENNDSLSADIPLELNEVNINLENNDLLSADIPLELNEVNINLENNDSLSTDIALNEPIELCEVKVEIENYNSDIALDEVNINNLENNDSIESNIDISLDEININLENNDSTSAYYIAQPNNSDFFILPD